MPENERRKFLKASLASLAAATGISGCKPKPEVPAAMCYSMPAPDLDLLPEEKSAPDGFSSDEPVTSPAEEPAPNPAPNPTDEKAANREDLTEKLKELGEEEESEGVETTGAMCYYMNA